MPDRTNAMDLSAREIAARVARGDLSAESCARAALTRAREAAALNAFTCIDEARVREDARAIDQRRKRGERLGALAGVPFVVKDNIAVAGMPTAATTPAEPTPSRSCA